MDIRVSDEELGGSVSRSRFLGAVGGAWAAVSLSSTVPVFAAADGPATATIKFSFQGVHIYQARSPNTDTDYYSLNVRVGTQQYSKTGYAGDIGVGDHGFPSDASVTVTVPDDPSVPVVVGWSVINDNDGKDAALNLVGNVGLGIVGSALTLIPVVGDILSAAYGALVNPFRNHNGPVVAQQWVSNGRALNAIHVGSGGGPLNGKETPPVAGAKNYGRDLPGHEGSDYDSTVWLTRLA